MFRVNKSFNSIFQAKNKFDDEFRVDDDFDEMSFLLSIKCLNQIIIYIYWKNRVNSITYDEICLDCEEKSQTALFIYCHAWQSCDARLYLWR